MVALLAHLEASVCVCGDVGGESACDARIRGACEGIGIEILVCECFRDVCGGLTLLGIQGLCFVVVELLDVVGA